ncbi:MAG: aldo/keto reductase [Gammaproteobacteria bacterium]|jgi:aryl-alcohol dehydrogenase-like predicted oxidoreductase|nr:aldo/keto reductase [Gammaproteobacteria bacterium]MBU0772803.1 aldo/keto reductase [Gammaproteobacteria bacterium]MBU0856537.1 aldo/keto reductase [Gammaproteobacteria bacterium]MBU1847569.1 aldo/keto reductase [Gammaproteobacteria bacterium]
MNSTRHITRRTLGRSDLEVPAIGLGTMTFGQQVDEATAHAIMDEAFDAGIDFLDAAEMYPVPARAQTFGETERIVGSWLARKPRESVIIASKVAGPARGMPWIRGGPLSLGDADIREAIEGSLRRLRTDYIDLYQIHWPARNVPMFGHYEYDPAAERECASLRSQLESLSRLVDEGKVRHVGVSNETPWGLMSCLRLADEGLPRVVSIQNAYHLLNRTFDMGLSEVCSREQVSLLAYSPLGFGHLSGKYVDHADAPGRITEFPQFGQRYFKENVAPASRAYAELARSNGLTPAQLALAFCYRRRTVASTLIGVTSGEQLRENIGAWSVTLNDELLASIDALHLRYTNPAP